MLLDRINLALALALSLHTAHSAIAPHCCVRSSRANRTVECRPNFPSTSFRDRAAKVLAVHERARSAGYPLRAGLEEE